MEFLPLGAKPEAVDLLLHEAGYLPRRPHWNYQEVFSPFWRLYYDLRPGHKVVFRDKEVRLGPDRIVLIPDHQLFYTVGTEPKPKFWLHFSHALRPVPEQVIPIELAPADTEKSLVRDMIRLMRARETGNIRQRVYHCGLALLHLLLSRPEIRWQTETPADLLDVIRYIQENYASPLYTAELARLAHMSESAFRRKFQKLRNMSPARFIAQLRVREAAHLLVTTAMDMGDIAERSGFPNSAYFSRVFKQVTGESPAQFRRQFRS